MEHQELGYVCVDCHEDCETCNGPTDTDCLACKGLTSTIREDNLKCVDCDVKENRESFPKECKFLKILELTEIKEENLRFEPFSSTTLQASFNGFDETHSTNFYDFFINDLKVKTKIITLAHCRKHD
jgi:hypothetical protein